MEDFAPNSHRFKEEQKAASIEKKKVEKVVTGKVRTKKKNEMHKLADIFISEDAANVKSYILMDVLVPAIKKAVSDIVRDGIDMILYGKTGGKKRSSNADYVSYRDYSRKDDRRADDTRFRSRYSMDDLVFDSRAEAEEVRARMDEIIDMYDIVTVADLYDLVGITGQYTDAKYGWTNIRNADVIRVRDGYILKLPKALPIDR